MSTNATESSSRTLIVRNQVWHDVDLRTHIINKLTYAAAMVVSLLTIVFVSYSLMSGDRYDILQRSLDLYIIIALMVLDFLIFVASVVILTTPRQVSSPRIY